MNLRAVVCIRLLRFCIAVLFAWAWAQPCIALGADKCGSLDRVTNALLLTQALYPEFKEREFSLQFSGGNGAPLSSPTDARTLVITVDKPQWHPPGSDAAHFDPAPQSRAAQSDDTELPLYLTFSFLNSDSHSVENHDSGPVCRPVQFLNEHDGRRMREAKAVIDAHSEWTDAEESEAVNKLGLSFGPKSRTAVLRLVPLKDLSRLYGPLRITKAEFVMNGGGKCAGCSFADLRWWINVDEVDTQRALQITIEPFQGKINGISEHRRLR